MNRLVATLAVVSAIGAAEPPKQCDAVDAAGLLKEVGAEADYYLVAMLYAW